MYLITQIWLYLLLAFLLGALIGYLIWRTCNRPLIEARFERSRMDLVARAGHLEDERARFTGAGIAAESESSRLRTEVAALKTAAVRSDGNNGKKPA